MEYLFVYKDKGWWLKITNIQQLINYDESDTIKWHNAFSNLTNSKEFGHGMEHASTLAYAIGLHSERNKISALIATADLKSQRFAAQLDYLTKGYYIYINPKGGWHPVKNNIKDYTEWCKKDSIIFPDFKESELRIKQFPGGTHWYAYIGNMQLRNGDIFKWNTYKEAYEYAQQFLTK